MSYKTVLVHVDETTHASECIKVAASIARAENAHLIGIALTGVSRFIYQNRETNGLHPGGPNHLHFLQERASRALADFNFVMQSTEVPSYEARLIHDEAGDGISQQARYCDLIVLGQIDPGNPSPAVMPDCAEYVVMNSGRPVLIVPDTGRIKSVGRKILVFWDASREATRAVTDAIPLLQRAQEVRIAALELAPQSEVHDAQIGGEIAHFLARHGIQVAPVVERTKADTEDALQALAASFGSDLIVMGGYRRSRSWTTGHSNVRTGFMAMSVPVLRSR